MVTDIIVKALDVVLGPLSVFQPHVAIVIVSLIITAAIMLLNRLVVNKKAVNEIKEKMEQIREQMTQAQKEDNKENVQKYINEWTSINNSYMKHTFKTMIVSLVVLLLFYSWLGFKFTGLAVGIPFPIPFVGASVDWPIWYVIASLSIGWVSRKLFGAGI